MPGASPARRMLLVEDDPTHALLMREQLVGLGGEVRHAPTRRAAMQALGDQRFDLVILDVGLPDGSGVALHEWMRARGNPPPVVFVTADDRAEHAVDRVKAGAAHYVVKRPNYLARMTEVVSAVLATEAPARPRPAPGSDDALARLVGDSLAMQQVRRRVIDFASAALPVLVTGETGTGKELVARALHGSSDRSRRPFVPVNCAAIASTLFESELFGNVRGAFTGATNERPGLIATAEGGTLFLDEVGELTSETQAKLLRFLESGSYRPVGASRPKRADVRVVAATNRELDAAVAAGEFRPDLYYRLNVLRVHLPALRERRDDIPALVEHFVAHSDRGRSRDGITPAALAQLSAWSWPGNVRELEHTVERTLHSRESGPVAHFDFDVVAARALGESHDRDAQHLPELLTRHRGRLGPVARELGVSIRTVQRRMKLLGLVLRDFRGPRF